MIHSLRILPCWRARETGNRFPAVILALALLLLPCVAGAAEPWGGTELSSLLTEIEFEKEKDLAKEVLDLVALRAPDRTRSMRFGNWYVNPKDGYAVKIPEGMETNGWRRSTSVLLVDAERQGVSFRTSIIVTVTEPDKRLQTLTRREVENAYGNSLDRFKLLGFQREELYGEEGIRFSYVAHSSPQLLFQQELFLKNERCYIISVTAENSIRALPRAFEQLGVFEGSLVFAGAR